MYALYCSRCPVFADQPKVRKCATYCGGKIVDKVTCEFQATTN